MAMEMAVFGRKLSIEMCAPAKAGVQNSNANPELSRTGPRLSPGCTRGPLSTPKPTSNDVDNPGHNPGISLWISC